MRFRITGSDSKTGVEKTWDVNCDSLAEAYQRGNAAGYLVSEAEPVATEPTHDEDIVTAPPPAKAKPKASETALLIGLAIGQWAIKKPKQALVAVVVVIFLVAVVVKMATQPTITPGPSIANPAPPPSTPQPSPAEQPAPASVEHDDSAATPPASQRSIEWNLALIEADHDVPRNDPLVQKFSDLLDSIHSRCPNTRQEIGDMSAKAYSMLHDRGASGDLLSLMQDMNAHIPSDNAQNYSELVSAYMVLRLNPQ